MKKLILSAALAFMAVGATVAQTKEGFITYEASFEGVDPQMAAMFSGTELKIYHKGDKSRAEIANAFFNQVTVNDGKKTVMAREAMGQKTYTEISTEEKKKLEEKSGGKDPVIEYVNETKKIADYECKKAIVKTKDKDGVENTAVVWYTEQIPYTGQGRGNQFKGLKGAPLEFNMQMGPMQAKLTATEVKLTPVVDSKFTFNPEGYTKVSYKDFTTPPQQGK